MLELNTNPAGAKGVAQLADWQLSDFEGEVRRWFQVRLHNGVYRDSSQTASTNVPSTGDVTSALTTTRLNAPQALESQIYFRSA
jgi:hypothetical protein